MRRTLRQTILINNHNKTKSLQFDINQNCLKKEFQQTPHVHYTHTQTNFRLRKKPKMIYTQEQQYKRQQTKKFFNGQSLLKTNPNRIRRYKTENISQHQYSINKSLFETCNLSAMHTVENTSERQPNSQRWDVSLTKYMSTKQKLFQYFRKTKNMNDEFGILKLDRVNLIRLKNKKNQILSYERASQKNKLRQQFVSNLAFQRMKSQKTQINHSGRSKSIYQKSNTKFSHKKSFSFNKKTLKKDYSRNEVILVNFVSNYFRRKMYCKKKQKYTENQQSYIQI